MTPLRSELAFDFNMKIVAFCLSFPTQLAASQSDIPNSSYGTKNLIVEDESVFSSLPQDHSSLMLENGEKMKVHMDEIRLMGRRIDLELHDYEGPGANKEHDPKSPGNG
ncbi:hypothetical protein QL285_058804 [Trifolium repens]|nr:hypothetical protein QL285_058804 [Trifolium repens]